MYKIKDSYSQTEWEQRNYIRQKSVLVIAKSFYFREWQGSILSDYLTSADHLGAAPGSQPQRPAWPGRSAWLLGAGGS